ncbi:MAG TPA: HK97 family phage prohead protease [Mesorhizobium sp.]|nr:HK97 family phage prohead protease [Mesorhizobium sp.]
MNDLITLKAAITAQASGEIEAMAWPFGTVDRIGDMIEKGAFASIPLPLPMLFGHDHNDPVGAWTEAEERPDGLFLKGRLLVEDLPRAREVAALVKSGAVRGVSIGFITKKAAPRKGGRSISQLELIEASLVSIPMNPKARITSAKSATEALRIADLINRAAAHLKEGTSP